MSPFYYNPNVPVFQVIFAEFVHSFVNLEGRGRKKQADRKERAKDCVRWFTKFNDYGILYENIYFRTGKEEKRGLYAEVYRIDRFDG